MSITVLLYGETIYKCYICFNLQYHARHTDMFFITFYVLYIGVSCINRNLII